jgi:putative PIN family toxin of toxin-antitoxin system
MRVVVLDTNFIISAGIRHTGAPARLISDWALKSQVQIICCPSVLAEYRGVVRREKFRRYYFPPEWLETLIEKSLQLPEPETWPIECPDLKDAPFLALAKISGAWLITGNLKHFPENICDGGKVILPADYLAILEKGA